MQVDLTAFRQLLNALWSDEVEVFTNVDRTYTAFLPVDFTQDELNINVLTERILKEPLLLNGIMEVRERQAELEAENARLEEEMKEFRKWKQWKELQKEFGSE